MRAKKVYCILVLFYTRVILCVYDMRGPINYTCTEQTGSAIELGFMDLEKITNVL